MINTSYYTTIMSRILQEGSSGRFELTKKVTPKGYMIRMYTPGGYFYHDIFNRLFPTITLTEEPETGEPGKPLMSDTPLEQEALRIPTVLARGNVLILGLGIGLLPTLIKMRNKTIRAITIVEKEKDVIKLVYNKIKYSKTSIVQANAEDFLAESKKEFDFIFIDVWSSLTAPMKQIDAWTELARPRLAEGGKIRCWLQELYDRIKGRLPKEPIFPTGPAGIHEPCLLCGKKLRNDYAGLCMDCADKLGVSEMFMKE